MELDEPVVKVTAEADDGSFTLLPRHVDFLATLVPGLVSYETEGGQEAFLAVDGGTLVKCGSEVLVSTTRAVRGPGLEDLQRTVTETFRKLGQREQTARSAFAKIEADFVRRLLELEEHG
jgi:F-type H+-transporting ATPase subunit epsilon